MKDIILKMSLKNFTDLDTTKMMANLAKRVLFSTTEVCLRRKSKDTPSKWAGWIINLSTLEIFSALWTEGEDHLGRNIEFIEKKIERPIKIIGNGPRREDIIVCF